MFNDQFEFPGRIKGQVLDEYLENGWYRTGCVIFTTHFLAPFGDERRYRVYWLRYIVDQVQPDRKTKAIRALNKDFTVEYLPFRLTEEVDVLHKKYAPSVKFNACNDLSTILVDINNDIYDSYIIEVRDKGKLIAAGVFDKGKDAIEGIINFYDPEYKKYSLGKYLILLKHRYCSQNGIPYYYPGYYMPAQPVFDYKLFISKPATEVYLPEYHLWINYNSFLDYLEKTGNI